MELGVNGEGVEDWKSLHSRLHWAWRETNRRPRMNLNLGLTMHFPYLVQVSKAHILFHFSLN